MAACCAAVHISTAAPLKGPQRGRILRYHGGPEIADNLAFAFDAGDSYRSLDGQRSLKRIAGLIAIIAEVDSRELTAPGGPLEDFSVRAKTGSEVTIFAAPPEERARLRDSAEWTRAITRLRGSRGVLSANPVFMDPRTGRWLILAQRIIVKLKPGIDANTYFAGEPSRVTPLIGTTDQFLIWRQAAPAEEILQEVNRRFADHAVEWAEPDVVGQMIKHAVPNDPLFGQQWHLHNTGQGHGKPDADVDAPEAWNITTGSSNVVIAVLDDSVQISHPDLSANIFRNSAEVSNGIDDDNNGYVDDLRGWDFVDNDNDPSPILADDDHGTACAGVAAAAGNNGQGVAGVAYNCRILPLRVFGASSSTIAQAIYYAAGRSADGARRWRGADILSISLGLPQTAALDTAIAWAAANGRGGKGCPVFVASGNEASRWQTAVLADLAAGAHTYEWVYTKDSSVSAGADTAWLDGVIFPDGTSESFEGTSLPVGWSTTGNAAWFSVQNNVGGNHALTGWNGPNSRAVRAGAIGNNQTSGLRVTKTTGPGEIVFSIWVSAEYSPSFYFDHVAFYTDGDLIFQIDDDPSIPVVTTIDYPASHVDAIAVGASTDFDFRADYSCYAGKLDFVAPSGGGFSAIWTTDRIGLNGYNEGDYDGRFSGTSAACPLAAGVAGLILSANTNLSARNVRKLMQATCDKIGNATYTSGTNQFYGYGRVNAGTAASNAVPRISSIQTNTSTVVIRFASVSGWTYNLERATSIAGPWATVQSNIAGTGNVIQLTDARTTASATARYYRLRLLP
jgi:subtilisin family serine protease